MTADLKGALARFPDAVLSGWDGSGWPVSVRCRVRYDPVGPVLRGDRAAGPDLVDGPACLLLHGHDERLSRLRSLLVCGDVAREGAGWVLTPTRVVEGLGMHGPLGDLRGFLAARRRAARYLAARGLARPRVPWDRLRS